ncbi:hypothetical protein H6P81_011027 [Aristolochia fimbriata]|uniref:Uncharacterized protein n=1 Tax=Aristolochia fimbriata TaxID=158543 RepID=A0AAV7ETU8_ARIFI|nr:hypothetical protein H6P81_011027 [Aristolochia fimbriata]
MASSPVVHRVGRDSHGTVSQPCENGEYGLTTLFPIIIASVKWCGNGTNRGHGWLDLTNPNASRRGHVIRSIWNGDEDPGRRGEEQLKNFDFLEDIRQFQTRKKMKCPISVDDPVNTLNTLIILSRETLLLVVSEHVGVWDREQQAAASSHDQGEE